MVDISIIIVNYNGKKFLENCVKSIISQTYKNFEIIIVDNNSSDGSINSLKKDIQDSRIKYILNNDNLGFAASNNIGIREAAGEFILLLNNDTYIAGTFLEDLKNEFLSNNIDVISPTEISFDNILILGGFSLDILGYPYYNFDESKFMYLSGACLFFRKDFYLETKGLDNNFFMYFEEADWFWRIILLKRTFKRLSNIFVHHFGAGSSASSLNKKIFQSKIQNNLSMILKNYQFFSLIFILPIFLIINIFEIIYFLITLKPMVALAYFNAWVTVLLNISKILKFRKWVQENRLISDFEIFKKMYIGSAKLNHLINTILSK